QDGGGRFQGGDDRFDVLQLRAADDLRPSPEPPDLLAPAPDLSGDDVSRTRTFDLSGTAINGREMDIARIDETVTVDATERWVVRSADGGPHNVHLHGAQFRVESVDGAPPPPELAGWKDTVFLPGDREVALLLRFRDHTDPDTPYMVHCHLLRHEDQGMMAQFVVVAPGEQAGTIDHDGRRDGAGHGH
ncbi:MAG: multicopper oxidase domain-containing protein, partial [Phycicoccus sp.]